MEVEGVGDDGMVSEGQGEGDGTRRVLGDLEFLTQYAEPSGTTIVDDHNGFNDLRRLVMIWTVQHRWPTGARIAFDFYRYWAQLLLRQPGGPSVPILSQ